MDAGFWLPSAHVRFHKTETHIKYQTHGVVNDPRCVSTKRTREDSIPMYSLCLVHDTVLRKRAALAVNEHFPVCSVCGKTSLLYLHWQCHKIILSSGFHEIHVKTSIDTQQYTIILYQLIPGEQQVEVCASKCLFVHAQSFYDLCFIWVQNRIKPAEPLCQHMMEPNTSASLAKEHWFVQHAKQCRWQPERLQVSLTGWPPFQPQAEKFQVTHIYPHFTSV